MAGIYRTSCRTEGALDQHECCAVVAIMAAMAIPGVPDPAVLEAIEKRGNCVVFLDVAAAGNPLGRIKLELFQQDCPKTVSRDDVVYETKSLTHDGVQVKNFLNLCTGEHFVNENPVGYKGSTFHRVMHGKVELSFQKKL